MFKKVAAVSGGVLLGIAIAFARAGAFPFWSSQQDPGSPAAQSTAKPVASAIPAAPIAAAAPAAASQSEPVGVAVTMPSFAPLVKSVMPTVVNVAVVQEVNTSSMFGGGDGGPGGPGDQGGGPGDQGGPSGPGDQGGQGAPGGPGDQGGGPGDQGPFGGGPGGGDPFQQFRHFFGQIPHNFKQHGLGSGVIISSDGYILTNNHVVGDAEEIRVTLMDGREFKARVIGKDAKTDLALIKIDPQDSLPYAALGNSDKSD